MGLRIGVVHPTGVGHIQPLLVGTERNAVRTREVRCHGIQTFERWVRSIYIARQLFGRSVPFVIARDPVMGIGEPDRAVRLDHDVVGRIQPLSLEAVRDDGHRSVVLRSRDPPLALLA